MKPSFFHARSLAVFRDINEAFEDVETAPIWGHELSDYADRVKQHLLFLQQTEELLKTSSFLGSLAFWWRFPVGFHASPGRHFPIKTPMDFLKEDPYLETPEYNERIESIEERLSAIWNDNAEQILLEASIAKKVAREVSSVYSKAISAPRRQVLEKRWAAQLGFPQSRQSLIGASDLSDIEVKMLKDLNMLIDREISSVTSKTFKMAILHRDGTFYSATQSLFGLGLPILLDEIYKCGELGNFIMLALPKAVYDAFAAEGVTFLRTASVDYNPVLFETAGKLWDKNYEDNFGSLRELIATSEALT